MIKNINLGQKMIAILIFAVFMISSIPIATVIAQPIEQVNEFVGPEIPDELSDSEDSIIVNGDSETVEIAEGPVATEDKRDPVPDEKTEMVIESDEILDDVLEEEAEKEGDIKPLEIHKPLKEKEIRLEKIPTVKNIETPQNSINSVVSPTLYYIPAPPTTQWTLVSGVLATQTWDLAGSPYFVTGDTTIPDGVVLTIDPGVQVLFNGSFEIAVSGTLTAIGNSGSHIVFDASPTYFGTWTDIEFDATGDGTFTYVDFDGANDAIHFNDATNTVEISYCDFGTNIANYGIFFEGASTAGMNVHDNTFDTADYSFYENIYFSGLGDTTVGNKIFRDNTINGNWGYYSATFEFDTPMMGANIIVGTTQIIDNTFPAVNLGIRIGNYEVTGMEYGTVNWGDVTITGNFINQSSASSGIYFYGYVSFCGNMTANFGALDISGNNVTNSGTGTAINVDYWDIDNLFGTASCFFGPVTYKNNDLDSSGGGTALYTYNDAIYDLYDFSSVTLSDFTISGNTIWDSGNIGIYLDNEFGANLYDYSSIRTGDFIIDSNTIYDATSYGIYNYWYEIGYGMYQDSRIVVGDTYITNNIVTSNGDALYSYYNDFGYEVYNDAILSMGNTDILDNVFNSTNNDGGEIYVDDMGVYMFGDAQAWFGDFTCMRNDFISWSGTYALDADTFDYIGYELYGNSEVHYGDILFNENYIEGWHYGAYMGWSEWGYEIHDNSVVTVGNYEVNNNIIISMRDIGGTFQDGNGMTIKIDYAAEEAWGQSSVTIGHLQFNDNDITVLFGSAADGMYFSYIDDFGDGMYGTASFEMTGNIEICRNTVDARHGYYGIYYDIYDIGYEMYGDNTVIMQNFYNNDNTVWANHTGIYSYLDNWGEDMWGSSVLECKDFEMNRNTVWSNGSYGIYSDWEYFAYDMYNTASASFGHFQQNNNVINATVGADDGYYSYFNEFAYDLYGNNNATFGDIELNGNIVNSSSDGIYCDWNYFGEDIYGDSRVIFGDVFANDNIVNATDDGMYWTDFIYYCGNGMYDNSYLETGDWHIMRNNVTAAGDYGMYIYSNELGYELYDNAYLQFGNVYVNDNLINHSGTDTGLYWEMSYCLDDVEYNAEAHVGNFEFNNNNITSGGDGMYIEFDDLVTDLSENARAYVGSISANNNYIDTATYSGSYGLNLYMDSVCDGLEENSHGEVGDFEFANNIIIAEDEGIYFDYFYDVGSDLDDVSTCIVGDVRILGNDITSMTDDGIYCDNWYYVCYDIEDGSIAQIGDIMINDNTINATNGDGVYFSSFYDWGSYLSEGGDAIIGDFEFLRNDIIAMGGYGIYMDPYEFGEDLDYDSTCTIGDWLFNGNTITSSDTALYLDFYEFGCYNDESSIVKIGNHEVNDNVLNSTNGNGIYDYWLYYFGYDISEDSYVEIGDATFMNNDITTWNDYGMELGPYEFGNYVYDTSVVIAGDYTIANNTIYSDTDYGIYFYDYYIGYDLDSSDFSYSSSTVTLGDVKINDNTVHSDGDYAIYIDYSYVGYDINYDSSVTVGNFEFYRNDLTGYDGLYLYYAEMGYDLHDTATVTVGRLDIGDNTIDVEDNNEGIYLDTNYFADYTYDNSELYIGDISIHDNTILNAYDGIRIDNSNSQYVEDMSYAELPGMKVYNNTVNCSDYGLYLEYTTNVGNLHTSAVSIWPAWEIFNNTFTSDYGMYVDSDDAPAMPNWYVHDNSFTGRGVAGSEGIYIQDVDPANPFIVEDCTFDDYDYGIYAESGTYVRTAYCDFTNVGTDDVYLDTDSNVFMIDCVFDKTNVNYVDALSTLDIGWYFDVYTETPTGVRVPYANLEAISSGAPVITENDQTDANGYAQMMLRESRHNQANPSPAFVTNFNDHNITATKSVNTGWAIPEATVIGIGGSTIIILGDGITPTLGADNSDVFGTTGDPYRFATGAGDDMGIASVEVYYRVNAAGWTNTMMTYDGIWEHSFNVPHILGTIQHYFIVTDIGGNTITGSALTVPIFDNDAPGSYSDNTQAVIYSSTPNLDFSVGLTDNIAMSKVWLEWQYGIEPPTTVLMAGSGPYTHTLAVDFSKSVINYQVTAVDVAGNKFTGPMEMTIVNDTDVPVILSDNSDRNATTGDLFNFEINAIDNVDIVDSSVTYWYGSDAPTTEVLIEEPANIYSLQITIPEDSTDSLTYFFTLVDDGGNVLLSYLVGSNTTIAVEDNDAPELVSDNSDNTATTGDAFTFMAIGDDNVGVSGIDVVYWFGNGTPTITGLSEGGGIYSSTITIPSGSTAILYYYLVVTDGADNEYVQAQQDITVVDNDSPIITGDTSDTASVTGAIFDFGLTANDNIGISGAHLIYWFGSSSSTNVTLTGTSPYSYNITISAHSVADLHYYFAVTDAAGHWAVTPVTIISTVDGDAPEFGIEIVPGNTTENADVSFSIEASDNVGVTSIYVVYWTNAEGEYAYAQLTLVEGSYVGTISVPDGTEFHYYFVAEDGAGNSVETTENTLAIQQDEDNDDDVPGTADENFLTENWWIILVIVLIIIIILQAVNNKDKPEGTDDNDFVAEEAPMSQEPEAKSEAEPVIETEVSEEELVE